MTASTASTCARRSRTARSPRQPIRISMPPVDANLICHVLPKLPRPVLGIKELLDQRRLRVLLAHALSPLGGKDRGQVQDGLDERQALDPLRAPLRADFVDTARPTPSSVYDLKNVKYSSPPEAVDEETAPATFPAFPGGPGEKR